MEKPFFSVIIPTYNRADFLKIAIESVLNQSFKNFQLVIVDDGSTDRTKALINSYQDNRLLYTYSQNRGVSSARNLGISLSTGKYLSFLDSDDRFRNDKLQITYNTIKEHPEIKIFHSEEIWYQNGRLLGQKIYHKKPKGFVFETAVKLCSIGLSTAVINRSVFVEFGNFDETLAACEDYDFWLRVTPTCPVHLIEEALTIKQGGSFDQLSKKYPAMDRFRIYSLEKVLSSKRLTDKDQKIAYNELKRKCEIYIKGAAKRKNTEDIKKYQSLIEKFYIT